MTIIRKVLPWAPLFPPAALLLWAMYWIHNAGTPGMEAPLWGMAPYVLGLVAVMLGVVFHLSRVSFVALTGMCLYGLLDNPAFNRDCIMAGGAVIIPVNILVFFCLPDRGLWSRPGIVRLWLVLLEFLVVFIVAWAIPVAHTPPWFYIVRMLGISIMAVGAMYLVMSELRPGRLEGPAFALMLACMAAALFVFDETKSVEALRMMNGVVGCGLIYTVILLTWEHSFLDDLTQLPARKMLNHRLAQLSGSFSVAMVDVDNFKQLNDTYGHDVGDQVLKYIASHLKAVDFGTAYRYGGEEFAIISSGRDMEELLLLCDRLRAALAEQPFVLRSLIRSLKQRGRQPAQTQKMIPVTVSIGLAQSSAVCRGSQDVLIEADKALYLAKQNGRNRVECVDGAGSNRRRPAR